MAEPSPCKVYNGRTIHSVGCWNFQPQQHPFSAFWRGSLWQGAIREGAMPNLYRAPEILLRIAWAEKIDIWALGLLISCADHLDPWPSN